MDNCVPNTDDCIVDSASHTLPREDIRQDILKYNMPANLEGTIDRKNDFLQLQNFLPSHHFVSQKKKSIRYINDTNQ
jgi:hypothetical protein